MVDAAASGHRSPGIDEESVCCYDDQRGPFGFAYLRMASAELSMEDSCDD